MNEHDFMLDFRLPADSGSYDEIIEALWQAGCDDALVGIGRPGRVALDFGRKSESARDAVLSALADVLRAIPGATLIEASPDYVGLTDAAEILGFSRQNMRKLIMTGNPNAPAPMHEGNPSLWHLSHLLEWLRSRGRYAISDDLLDLAETTMQLNIRVALRSRRRVDLAVESPTGKA